MARREDANEPSLLFGGDRDPFGQCVPVQVFKKIKWNTNPSILFSLKKVKVPALY
jgi:hypothetical protein